MLVLVWIACQVASPPSVAKLRFAPWGSDTEAKGLVQRMLQVNKPWLEPRAVSAAYSLHRSVTTYSLRHGIQHQTQLLGPYSIVPGCKRALRVGSIVYTPLHVMVGTSTNYTVRMLGRTRWRGKPVIGVAVTFASLVACEIGMGGQTNGRCCYASYGGTNVLFLIDPAKGVPLLMRTSSTLYLTAVSTFQKETVLEFAPDFFEIDGGLAPRGFDWKDNMGAFREHQDFQIRGGAWIFNRGRGVWPMRDTGPGAMRGPIMFVVSLIAGNLHSSQELQLTAFRLIGEKQDPATNGH